MLVFSNFLNNKAPVVFVGTVIAPEDPAQVLLHDSPIVFDVTERLRGNVGTQISIYEHRDSCDYSFTLGKSYLVFAYFYNGRLMTSQLTLTRPTSVASAILRQLRAMNHGQRPASLFGYLGDGDPPQPSAGVTIEAVSKHRTFRTRSEADGSFEFSDLPPGSYSIKAKLSDGNVATTHARLKRGGSYDLDGFWEP